MVGVQILNEFTACVDATWGWNPPGAFLFLCSIVCLILAINFMIDCEEGLATIFSILSVVCLFFGLGVQANSVPVYEQHFQVIVDETCNMNEFFNKYELIERQGEIYVVKEITP